MINGQWACPEPVEGRVSRKYIFFGWVWMDGKTYDEALLSLEFVTGSVYIMAGWVVKEFMLNFETWFV